MARNVDVFGFDELEKEFNRVHKRYPNEADALLMASGRQVNKRVKALTPVHKGSYTGKRSGSRKPGDLRRRWRLKKVKLYKNGTVRVVREQSTDPIAHLIEYGHEIVRRGSGYKRTQATRARGRARMERVKLNAVQRSVRGIVSGGVVNGRYMLQTAMEDAQGDFYSNVEKLLDKITKDVQI